MASGGAGRGGEGGGEGGGGLGFCAVMRGLLGVERALGEGPEQFNTFNITGDCTSCKPRDCNKRAIALLIPLRG